MMLLSNHYQQYVSHCKHSIICSCHFNGNQIVLVVKFCVNVTYKMRYSMLVNLLSKVRKSPTI